jgi:hypothetical protein
MDLLVVEYVVRYQPRADTQKRLTGTTEQPVIGGNPSCNVHV